MIKKTRIYKMLSIMMMLILSSSIQAFPSEEDGEKKLYQAYSIASSNNLRIIDGENGEENIVYCYNRDYNIPGIKEGDEIEKTYYTRIESYLDSNDPYTEQYGKEKKERIAAVLIAGYPIDTYGLSRKYKLTEFTARYITQKLIWDINDGKDQYINGNGNDDLYYNELLKHSKIDKFEQGKLDLIGNFEFKKNKEYWSTSKLSTLGGKGSFIFDNLPEYMEIRDFNTNEILDKDIKVGQEFYIVSNREPNEDLKLRIKYKYQEVKLYFYKYHSGGIPFKPNKPFQNLVRGDLTDKINEVSLEIKANGNFEKPSTPPSIGGTTPDLPGEEGSTPDLPGDSGEAGKPETPGTGGTTPDLPGEEGSTPDLPGDSGEAEKPETPGTGGTTPDLPGEEGSTPDLPGDSGEAGKPETPGTGG
ncbi:Cys-Gln thioester bond-forming surface protein, partial [Clostridium sardiniense]